MTLVPLSPTRIEIRDALNSPTGYLVREGTVVWVAYIDDADHGRFETIDAFLADYFDAE